MTAIDELRARLGPGPATLVRTTDPPSLTVWVGAELVQLANPVNLNHDRIDLLCITVELGEVYARAVTGTPSTTPVPAAAPTGWLPIATARVRACTCFVLPCDIEEYHP